MQTTQVDSHLVQHPAGVHPSVDHAVRRLTLSVREQHRWLPCTMPPHVPAFASAWSLCLLPQLNRLEGCARMVRTYRLPWW